ncbi:Ammonium transporter 2 member 5 [Linum perenne]
MNYSAAPAPFVIPLNLATDDGSPDWLSKGDNAWQLTAATLVGLQSVPGLIILYGGGVKKKWAVNSAFMALYAFACVLFCWVCWGYRMSFGDNLLPFWGEPNVALGQEFLLQQTFGLYKMPNATMVYFQFVFAAITLILIAGAVLGRMNFYAWMMFVPMWLTFSYTFGAFSIWCPNGFLFKKGLIDYSGGSIPWFTMMVVHKNWELLQKVDDTMAVFHTHAVAGTLGGILTGLFAEPRLNYIFYATYGEYVGLLYGFNMGDVATGFRQIGVQLLGIVFIVGLNIVSTTVICLVIQLVVPLRMSEEDMEIGDEAAHGEEAYAIWGSGERYDEHSNLGM